MLHIVHLIERRWGARALRAIAALATLSALALAAGLAVALR